MHRFMRRSIAGIIFLALLISLLPTAFAATAALPEQRAATEISTITPVPNDNLDCSQQKILGYWINPSNYTISDTNIDRLTARGVTDLYVLVKGEAGSINTTSLKNVISYADSSVRVHAWVMCARDNTYIRAHPTHAVRHFRFGYKNNAHSSSSSYYVDRNGYVDLRNTSYQAYFNGIVDDLEAISGLDGIHLDTIRYGGDYYDYGTNFKNEVGQSNYNAIAKAMCAQHGYTYTTDDDGYVVFANTTTADDESLTKLVNSNSTAAKAYIKYRTGTITNFVKSVKEHLADGMILTAACMPEPAVSLYGKSTYGQDFASLAPYVDYVQIMSYFGDYYFLNNDTYDTQWPANLCKSIAKEGCNVVAGIQGYAFVNTDSSGRNGMNPSGYESRTQAEYINDARREVNGDPTYGGDILGSAVFRTGTGSQVKIAYDRAAGTVKFSFVNGATAVKSIRIQLYNGFYVDKSKCTVSGTSYTYNGVTYTAGGTASNGYYPRLTVDVSVSAYATKSLTIPVCTDTGEAISGSFNNEHFAAYTIFSSTSRGNSTYLPVYQASFVDSTHTKCTFTKTTPQPATCLAAGYNLYTCATCGYDYAEYLPQLSHEYVKTVVEPTCEAQGYSLYSCKNGCDDTYKEDYVDAIGHSYEATVVAPTCEAQGYTIYNCSNGCGSSYQDSVVDALGHSYNDGEVTLEPTCTEPGSKLFTCVTCNHSYTEELNALGHGETTVETVNATCTDSGAINTICSVCNETIATETIEATGHSYEVTTTEPSCTLPGGTVSTCKICGHVENEEIPATGHQYDNGVVAKEATCTDAGERVFTCCVCDDSYSEEIPATGHNNIVQTTIDPTCTQEGSVTVTCDDCHEVLGSKTIEALGHDYEEKVTEPTCTEAGEVVYTCKVCDDSYTETIDALGHGEAIRTELAPTCTKEGYINENCSVCGLQLSSRILGALGHSYEAAVTAPTCTLGGYTTYTCSVCDDTYTDNETAELGHDCLYTDNGEDHTATCKNCDYAAVEAHDSEGVYCSKCNAFICKHQETETIVDVEATCTAVGYEHVQCADCGELISESEIAMKGHSLINVKAKQPTCTEDGNRNYSYCETCGSYFTDETCSYEIPASFATKPAKGHDFIYTDNGELHTVSCSRCSENKQEQHVFEDGVCVCGAAESIEPVYEYDKNLDFFMNISVGAEMQVRYTVMAAKVQSFERFYLVVTKAVADGESKVTTFEMDDMSGVVNPTSGTVTAYQATYAGINAKEMGDVFETVLYAVAADGTIHYSATKNSSIKSYLIEKINAAGELSELKTMAVDMLNYGAAAQLRMGYDTENLVNADLTPEQLAYATKEAPQATDYSSSTSEGVKLIASVSLQSKVMLYINCNYKEAVSSEMVYVITNSDNEVIERIPAVLLSNGWYQLIYDRVGAKQMRELVTITLYDGQKAVSQSLTWSVESYVASVCQKATATEDEIAMAKMLLIFGDSVAKYMKASGQ